LKLFSVGVDTRPSAHSTVRSDFLPFWPSSGVTTQNRSARSRGKACIIATCACDAAVICLVVKRFNVLLPSQRTETCAVSASRTCRYGRSQRGPSDASSSRHACCRIPVCTADSRSYEHRPHGDRASKQSVLGLGPILGTCVAVRARSHCAYAARPLCARVRCAFTR
jgi:hypothetical protein